MRKSTRAIFLAFLTFLAAIAIGVASTLTAAVTLAATALIVPGTGTHNANSIVGYNTNARDRYIAPFSTSCTDASCTLNAIEYPASFWPIPLPNWCPGLTCDTWNVSVGTGVSTLDQTIRNTNDTISLFGYSQGGAVVSDELRNLVNDPTQLAKISDVTMIGNILNPDGGLWNRLGFLGTIPIFNVTFGPPMLTDFPAHITNIGFQYDPVVYAPLYWSNPFAMLNALAAFETVHGFYLAPNGNDPTATMPYGYTDAELAEQLDPTLHPENFRYDSKGNTYVMIPAKSLPLSDLVMSVVPAALTPVVKPFVDLATPVLKVLADLGYDWSGDPGTVRWLSPLPFNPFQNWLAVGANLAAAAVQGVQAFLGDLGVGTTIAPVAPAPTSTLTVSTLAARSAPADTSGASDTVKLADTNGQTSKATEVAKKSDETSIQKGDETVVNKTGTDAVEKTGTSSTQTTATQTEPSKTDNPPATKPEDSTKPEEKKGTEGTTKDDTTKDDAKKDSTNGSVSLSFSPKKTTEGQTSGTGTGQTDSTGTAAASTGTDSAQAAA
ncbi:PE-PPE domain-containing protein [Mycobacterium sp. MMS18-G62]